MGMQASPFYGTLEAQSAGENTHLAEQGYNVCRTRSGGRRFMHAESVMISSPMG